MITKEEFIKAWNELLDAPEKPWISVWDFIEPHLRVPHDYELLLGEVTLLKEENEQLRIRFKDYASILESKTIGLNLLGKEYDAALSRCKEAEEKLSDIKSSLENQRFESAKKEAESAQAYREWLKSRDYWLRTFAASALQGIMSDASKIDDKIIPAICHAHAKNLCDELEIK